VLAIPPASADANFDPPETWSAVTAAFANTAG